MFRLREICLMLLNVFICFPKICFYLIVMLFRSMKIYVEYGLKKPVGSEHIYHVLILINCHYEKFFTVDLSTSMTHLSNFS